jgi:serine/threonine-protein kinase
MFEWLTGYPPYPRANPFAITYAHIRGPVPFLTTRRPWLPSALNAVFAKSLAKNPAERYSSCTEFVSIVARAVRDISLPQNTFERRWWRRPRR